MPQILVVLDGRMFATTKVIGKEAHQGHTNGQTPAPLYVHPGPVYFLIVEESSSPFASLHISASLLELFYVD